MAPKVKPKPQPPRRRQADIENEKSTTAEGASSSTSATAALPEPVASSVVAQASSSSSSSSGPSLRPPVARLESISGSPPVPGPAKAPLKFKPKSIARRTKEEREKTEREEQERLAARAAATASTAGAGRGGGNASRRARGDPRGGGMRARGGGRGGALGGDRVQGMASGPFASASVIAGQKKCLAQGLGHNSAGSSTISASTSRAGTKVKVEQGAASEQDGGMAVAGEPDIKTEADELFKSESDEEDANEGERVNIEFISRGKDHELFGSPSAKGKGREGGLLGSGIASTGVLFPIRIDRRDHVGRAVGAGVESSLGSSTRAGAMRRTRGDDGLPLLLQDEEFEGGGGGNRGREKRKDVEFIKPERKWRGVYEDDDDVEVKPEPAATDAAADPTTTMAVDTPLFAGAAADDDDDADVEMTDAPPPPGGPPEDTNNPQEARPAAQPRAHHHHHPAPAPAPTAKDREEHARHEADMRLLAAELGPAPATPPPRDPKEGRLYLFQLPP
ncbi:hypothetical protein FGG08_006321, partial [Glutinoglossum americanum]